MVFDPDPSDAVVSKYRSACAIVLSIEINNILMLREHQMTATYIAHFPGSSISTICAVFPLHPRLLDRDHVKH